MSAKIKRACNHCNVLAIPTDHRCSGKQSAIDNARQHREDVKANRPKQFWFKSGVKELAEPKEPKGEDGYSKAVPIQGAWPLSERPQATA